jgi:dihydropteroate synthase
MDFDSKMVDVVAEYQAGIVLQHSTLKTEDRPSYNNIVEDVYSDLLKKSQFAQEKGVKNIILDVGIGFGKSKNDNLEILNRIEEFYSLNYPIMIGVSRKSFLEINDSADNYTKDALTLAISYPLINKKVDFLRVHNVKLHRQLLDLAI